MTGLRFGLIGSGYIGRAHAIALATVGAVFPDIEPPVRERLADSSPARARQAAAELGFRRATGDWRELVADPAVDAVSICTPNHLHAEMALAAAAAGKHLWCEKPLATDAATAAAVTAAVIRAGVHHLVGFNYSRNPLITLARELVQSGTLGEPTGFRGHYFEDYLADPRSPHSWRCERARAGAGALADLGTHLIEMAETLLGPIAAVSATTATVHSWRPDAHTGVSRRVENEDLAQALVRFANGVGGSLEVSRVATGFQCGLAFTLFATRGCLAFDQERMNELRVYDTTAPVGQRGFRTILAGPEHGEYRYFCPAPGHGLGINDLKCIELAGLIRAIRDGTAAHPGCAVGLQVQRVVDAIERAAATGTWHTVGAEES